MTGGGGGAPVGAHPSPDRGFLGRLLPTLNDQLARGEEIVLHLRERAHLRFHPLQHGDRKSQLGRRGVAREPDDLKQFSQARSLPKVGQGIAQGSNLCVDLANVAVVVAHENLPSEQPPKIVSSGSCTKMDEERCCTVCASSHSRSVLA